MKEFILREYGFRFGIRAYRPPPRLRPMGWISPESMAARYKFWTLLERLLQFLVVLLASVLIAFADHSTPRQIKGLAITLVGILLIRMLVGQRRTRFLQWYLDR